MNVLVIEDDSAVSSFICNGLNKAGHTVKLASTGDEGLSLAQTQSFDVLVVDRMLPGKSGIDIVTTLRQLGMNTPTLFLSALDSVEEKVKGLRAGAEDYLTKPFAFEELLARLELLHSRFDAQNAEKEEQTLLTAHDLQLNLLTREAQRKGKRIVLKDREFNLLAYLLRNQGKIVTRSMLLEEVWDYNFDPQTNLIDVHISRLRNKVDKGFELELIETVRGAGYRIVGNKR
jgi:two-component system OmpR family response regulator